MAVETFDNGTTCFSKANNETKWNMNLEFRQISHKIDCYLYVHPWSSWNGQCLNITPLKIWLGHQKLFLDTMGQNITKKKKNIREETGKQEQKWTGEWMSLCEQT